MSGDTIECFNCGHANPSWAQVCRQCGFALRPDGRPSGAPHGVFPTDQASLISIGGTLGAIVLAIGLGLFFAGLLPPAPNVALGTPSPTPSPTPLPSISEAPSVAGSLAPSVSEGPALPGTITFGTGWDNTAQKITGETTAFTAASGGFAHSINLSEPIGVDQVEEEVVLVEEDGAETVVQSRADGTVLVNATRLTDGLKSSKTVAQLITAWGSGTFILRVYRSGELLAEGTFTFS